MSYNVSLLDPVTKQEVLLDDVHIIKGANYVVGGSKEASLSITYNYSNHYKKVFGEKGIDILQGLSGAESISILKEAISKLGEDVSSNYWESTEGNAKRPLYGLLAFARLRPDGVWDIS